MLTLRGRPRTYLLLWSLVVPLVGVLAGCTDRTLPTAVPTARHQAVVVQQGARLAVVSAGASYTCALKSDGTVACWGANGFGQATPPAGTFTEVSAGGAHACGVKSDGTVACWGLNDFGESTPPAGTFTQVSAGQRHTCGVKSDGTVACWGDNDFGKATPLAGTFTQVSVGQRHTCGVKSDGTVACWGDNTFGQTTPPAETFTQVSAGEFHTCGVKSDGVVACWGDNSFGQATPPAGTAAAIPGVSAGGGHTCGLKGDGTVACWGVNSFGQATPSAGTFTQVSAGETHTCGVKSDGTVACWGANFIGQATPPAGTFTQVSASGDYTCGVQSEGTVACWGKFATPPAGTFTQVSAGGATCGVKSDGSVACWGNNGNGQATPPAGMFTQVSAGGEHTCGVKSDGTVACWGLNNEGQATPPAGTFTQVSAGIDHTCGVKSDGTVACWGLNNEGQATPPAGTFTQVSAGEFHTCGVKSEGAVACWGSNSLGQATVPAELAGIVATTTTLTVSPGTQQYSDGVLLTASVLPVTATGIIQFRKSVDGGSFTNVGIPVGVGGGGSEGISQQILEAAGTAVQFEAVFTPTGSFSSSTSAAQPLTVTKENATILYAGTNPAALQVASPGGSLAAGSLTLALQVKESSPDLDAATAGLGDVANAGLSVTLAPVGPGTSYPLTCTAGPVSGTGYDAVRPFTCTNPAAVTVNAYEVQAAVTGDYYTGTYSDAFTVFDPSLGFATGGGSFVMDGESVNFGFTMKYNNGGTNLQGNFIAVRHRADGTVARLKSNALAGLAVGEDPTVPMGWATFGGKATYTTWDAGTAGYVTVGNQGFAVYAEDRNNPGTGVDRIWIGGPGALAMPGTPATATANAAALTGGNIGILHGAGNATP